MASEKACWDMAAHSLLISSLLSPPEGVDQAVLLQQLKMISVSFTAAIVCTGIRVYSVLLTWSEQERVGTQAVLKLKRNCRGLDSVSFWGRLEISDNFQNCFVRPLQWPWSCGNGIAQSSFLGVGGEEFEHRWDSFTFLPGQGRRLFPHHIVLFNLIRSHDAGAWRFSFSLP